MDWAFQLVVFGYFSWNRLAGCVNAPFKVTGSRFIVQEAAENIRINNNNSNNNNSNKNRDRSLTESEFTDTSILPSSSFI